MKILIDATVHNAHKYYATYLSEPSLAGDITFTSADMSLLKDITLELLLDEMAKAGSSGELMIVTHSVPEGFKMNLSPDSK